MCDVDPRWEEYRELVDVIIPAQEEEIEENEKEDEDE